MATRRRERPPALEHKKEGGCLWPPGGESARLRYGSAKAAGFRTGEGGSPQCHLRGGRRSTLDEAGARRGQGAELHLVLVLVLVLVVVLVVLAL